MDLSVRCRLIANTYYNRGLKLAAERDLSGAFLCLSRALTFDKSHIQARNLLGLICYETGELGDALVHWVISTNLSPERNPAAGYLEEVRKDEDYFQSQSEAIRQFNQALQMARSGSDDLAVIRLNKILEANPRYLRAQLLLGTLQMAAGEPRKAARALRTVLSIDHGNQAACRYLEEAREQSGSAQKKPEEKEIRIAENAEIIRTALEDNDTVIMPTYKEHSWLNTALHIAAGLIIGAAAVVFLYMPIRSARMTESHHAEIAGIFEELSDANKEIDDLHETMNVLQEELKGYQEDSAALDDQFSEKLAQYQHLLGILEKLEEEDLIAAAKLYADTKADLITDIPDGTSVSSRHIWETVSARMQGETAASLIAEGDKWFSWDNYSKSLDYYEASMLARPENPEALYKQGRSYVKLGDRQKANDFFTRVITEYPGNEFAELSRQARGY